MNELVTTILSHLGTFLWASLAIYYFLVIFIVILGEREPNTALAWLFVLLVFPYLGIFLYIFLGRDWKRIEAKRPFRQEIENKVDKMMKPIYASGGPKAAKMMPNDVNVKGLAKLIKNQDKTVPLLGRVEYLPHGKLKFDRLKKDLRQAKKFIHLEYFIWEKDVLTREITDILLERINSGVAVRITYDWLGCLLYGKSELRELRKAGAEVYPDIRSIHKINYRNHCKIVNIDKGIGYIGGINIGQEYIDGGKKYPYWRDTHIRVEGDFAAECQKLFASKWYELKKGDLFKRQYFLTESVFSQNNESATVLQMAESDVADYWESLRRTLTFAISNAKKRAWVQSPYFVPEISYYENLIDAALAGIDVRLMMTGWPDKKIAFYAATSYYRKFLLSGGKIYTYQKGFFHAKTMLVDDNILTIGTTNIDVRSLKLHEEANAFIYDEVLAKKHAKVFEEDLKDCHEVTLEEVNSYTPWQKFRNSAARLFSNLL